MLSGNGNAGNAWLESPISHIPTTPTFATPTQTPIENEILDKLLEKIYQILNQYQIPQAYYESYVDISYQLNHVETAEKFLSAIDLLRDHEICDQWNITSILTSDELACNWATNLINLNEINTLLLENNFCMQNQLRQNYFVQNAISLKNILTYIIQAINTLTVESLEEVFSVKNYMVKANEDESLCAVENIEKCIAKLYHSSALNKLTLHALMANTEICRELTEVILLFHNNNNLTAENLQPFVMHTLPNEIIGNLTPEYKKLIVGINTLYQDDCFIPEFYTCLIANMTYSQQLARALVGLRMAKLEIKENLRYLPREFEILESITNGMYILAHDANLTQNSLDVLFKVGVHAVFFACGLNCLVNYGLVMRDNEIENDALVKVLIAKSQYAVEIANALVKCAQHKILYPTDDLESGYLFTTFTLDPSHATNLINLYLIFNENNLSFKNAIEKIESFGCSLSKINQIFDKLIFHRILDWETIQLVMDNLEEVNIHFEKFLQLIEEKSFYQENIVALIKDSNKTIAHIRVQDTLAEIYGRTHDTRLRCSQYALNRNGFFQPPANQLDHQHDVVNGNEDASTIATSPVTSDDADIGAKRRKLKP